MSRYLDYIMEKYYKDVSRLIKSKSFIRSIKQKYSAYKFCHNDYFINMIAIRNQNVSYVPYSNFEPNNNEFGDLLIINFETESYFQNQFIFPITTMPGEYYLDNPINPKGCSILVPDQYQYKMGLHKDREALVQNLPVNVVRVREASNYRYIYKIIEQEYGFFGMNIHDAYDEQQQIQKASAGCQVFYDKEDYNIFISLCKKHVELYGNNLYYTLIEKSKL